MKALIKSPGLPLKGISLNNSRHRLLLWVHSGRSVAIVILRPHIPPAVLGADSDFITVDKVNALCLVLSKVL